MTDSGSQPEYDIIFVGGGAAACVTAGRLAEADPSLRILIVEAGPHTKNDPEHVQPGRYFRNFVLPRKTFTFHKSNPSNNLAGRSVFVAAGKCVGGGSGVNFVAYTRAAASDYDDWENEHGNKGWSSNHLIPLLRKAETYQAVSTNGTHGKSGPIKVSFAKDQINVANEFLATGEVYDKNRGPIDDLNGFYACNGYGRWARYVDKESGKRSDAAHHYIYTQEENKNLVVIAGKRVVRILFEGKRAIGIEYIDSKESTREACSVALASKLVVLSAGPFGSPAILERSGIGAAPILRKLDIQQTVDLPGVGENYQDHHLVFTGYIAADYIDSLEPLFKGTEKQVEEYATQWLKTGQGLMQHNGMDAGIKIRPTAADIEKMSPLFKARWANYYANKPDKPATLLSAFATGPPFIPKPSKSFSVCYIATYPASTGSTHVTSGNNPHAPLDFDPGFLSAEADLEILKWVYKHGRELARRMPMYRGELVAVHPVFPEGSEAYTGHKDGPVPIDAPPIKYTEEDDKAIDDFHRRTVETTWHSLGTCSMRPKEKGGVVDARLNVYGIENLKVADISIAPSNVGANTYNTAIAIGEKAAVLISQDLGIKGVTESD